MQGRAGKFKPPVSIISFETRFKRPVTKGVVEARAAIVERNGFIIKGACEI